MDHRRQHGSIFAASEKRLLVAIAERLPASINSDHLSLLALGSMALAGVGFALFRLTPLAGFIVIAGLAGNWFGDSLDGTVARVRGHERPHYGFYVDHVLDLLGATFLLGGLAVSGLMSPAIALALLIALLLVLAETFLATSVSRVFTLSFAGIGPTELRVLIAAGVLRAMMSPLVTFGPLGQQRFFDVGGAIGAAGLTIAFLVQAARQTRALYRAEPLPRASSARMRAMSAVVE